MTEYLCLLATSKNRQTDIGHYRSSSHVYWCYKCHIAWKPKCQFRILKDKLVNKLYITIYILCGKMNCEVLKPNDLHLVVIVPPKIFRSTLMEHLQGRSASRYYNRFPYMRRIHEVTTLGYVATL